MLELCQQENIHLLRCLDGLKWLNNNLDRFIPSHNGYLTNDKVKAFGELAVVYGYLKERQTQQFSNNLFLEQTLPIWRTFLIQHFEHPVYAEMIRKRPWHAFYLLIPYLVMRGTGYQSSYYEESLSRWRRWGFPQAMEVVPYRHLDQQYILWKSGFLTRKPNWEGLYKKTILAKKCNCIYMDLDAAYSVTHTLFYLTDFGNSSLPFKLKELERITNIVECLLIHYWRVANWDLVGELLTNLNCLGKQDSVIYSGAANALHRVWRKDGSIPANRNCEIELSSVQHEIDPLIFQRCYHTTLVGVFYCGTISNKPNS